MKTQYIISGIIVAILVTVTIAATYKQPANGLQQWEYLEECKPKDMNKRGAEGWELVAVSMPSGISACLFYKRPKK